MLRILSYIECIPMARLESWKFCDAILPTFPYVNMFISPTK